MSTALTAVPLMLFWLVLTGSLAPSDLILGLALSATLSIWAERFLWTEDQPVLSMRQLARFCLYLPHLLVSVILAALQVAEVVLDPRMPIKPVLITHQTTLSSAFARVTFANSVTLTPGTLTVDVEDGSFRIHSLAESFATDIASGDLERRIAHIFGGERA